MTERLADEWEYFVQTTHPGAIQLDGDTASGRAYVCELGRLRDGRSVLNYALFHDRYRRTPDGWKFTERVFEVRYFDTTPLAGSPQVAWAAVFTAASETLRLSGIDDDINTSGQYQAIKPRLRQVEALEGGPKRGRARLTVPGRTPSTT